MAGKPTYKELERRIKDLEEAVDLTATVESLQVSQEKYRAVFETAKDAIFLTDETGRFLDVNLAACESLGYSKEELLQRCIRELDPDPRGYEAFLKVRDKLAEKITLEVNHRKKDGTLLPVEITGSFFQCQRGRMGIAIARNVTERKRAEEMLQKAHDEMERMVEERTAELAKSEARYRQMVENPLVGVWQADIKGRFVFISKRLAEMSGYSQDEVIGTSMMVPIAPELRSWLAERMQKRKAGKLAPEVVEAEMVRKDGSRYTALVAPATLYDEEEKFNGFIGSMIDITERKRAREKIKRLSSAVEQSIDGIAIGDLEPKLTYVNNAFSRMHGYSAEEMIGMKVVNLHNEEQMDEYERDMHQIKTQGSWIGEIGHIRKDGTPFPTYMSVTLLKDDNGMPAGILAVARDITERKQAEGALRESEAQKKAILDASVDRIRLVDTDMRIIWANKTTTRELNMASEDLVGQPCYRVLHDNDAPCALCPSKKAATSGNIEHNTMHQRSSKGIEGETYWDNYSVPIKNESGDIINLIQVARNITERVQAEQALREREKELEIKTESLEETNAALRVLLNRRDQDKTELEEKVLSNVRALVIPFLEKVKKSQLNPKQVSYIDILELNLNDIISPFLRNFCVKYTSLTPTEIQVAHLVSHGVRSKEIANLLDLSKRTIDSHRANIRRKLKIKNKQSNLTSYLSTIR